MAHIIEVAKSGRASCRTCKKSIAKGELRLGVEVANAFDPDGGTTHQWHHLDCGAKKKPAELKQALESTDVDVPNKDKLLKTLTEAGKKEKPSSFPYAERAPTNRSTCLSCGEKINKDEFRVAIEVEIDTGSFVRKGPGYLHPACAVDHTGEDDILDKIKANTLNLEKADLEALEAEFE